jgi:hypothetical protein
MWADVGFGAHYGLKSDIAPRPKRAKKSHHCSIGYWALIPAALMDGIVFRPLVRWPVAPAGL